MPLAAAGELAAAIVLLFFGKSAVLPAKAQSFAGKACPLFVALAGLWLL